MTSSFDQCSISELLARMGTGELRASELLADALSRIETAAHLNAVVVRDPAAEASARESDRRYRNGTARPLEGIPFTVKDSYLAKGLTAASGSPAFAGLRATSDAFTVATLREAGAVLIGKTNMPPMADGGMQRGLYGRSESPFNADYLPAAYASGSSHGSAVAVASGMGVFGMAEETVSSGRSPASNNGIVAYTPSRGILSVRGNWPLFPTRDVVVPHTRSIDDLLTLLDVLVIDDPVSTGDLWREQDAVAIPLASSVRPRRYAALATHGALDGARLAIPRRYLGEDPSFPMTVHPDILRLMRTAMQTMEEAGAELVLTDFPLVDEYEGHSPAQARLEELGGLPDGWMSQEFGALTAVGWDLFLRGNADNTAHGLTEVDPALVFPLPDGQLIDRYPEVVDNLNRYDDVFSYARAAAADGRALSYGEVPGIDAALRRLEELRTQLLEDWLDKEGLDAVVFPANLDVARSDADRDERSADHAWRDGVHYSTGNLAIRHLGVPTVVTSMGVMPGTGMPVGITFAGRAYDDSALLRLAGDYERRRGPRPLPPAL